MIVRIEEQFQRKFNKIFELIKQRLKMSLFKKWPKMNIVGEFAVLAHESSDPTGDPMDIKKQLHLKHVSADWTVGGSLVVLLRMGHNLTIGTDASLEEQDLQLAGLGECLSRLLPRQTTPSGSRWLPMAAAHTNTRCLWLPMAPNGSHRLPTTPTTRAYSPTTTPRPRLTRGRGGR